MLDFLGPCGILSHAHKKKSKRSLVLIDILYLWLLQELVMVYRLESSEPRGFGLAHKQFCDDVILFSVGVADMFDPYLFIAEPRTGFCR